VGSPAGVGIAPLGPSSRLAGNPSGCLGASLASSGSCHAGQIAYGLPGSLVVGDYFTPRSGFGSGTIRRRSNVEFGPVRRSKDRLTSRRDGTWVSVHC